MAFYIRKTANGLNVWLKREMPWVAWGPEDQARVFANKSDALWALRSLPREQRHGVTIVGEPAAQSAGGR